MNSLCNMIFGSHLYGTNTETSDHDYKGVFMPTMEQILLQKVPKSIHTTTKKGEGKNSVEDVETETYSLHHFIHLACEGETVALDMLHAPECAWLESSYIWKDLVSQRSRFYTKNLKAFVVYARRQAAKYGVKGSRLAEAKVVLEFLRSNAPFTINYVWNILPTGEHVGRKSEVVAKDPHGERCVLYYEVCGKRLIGGATCAHYIPMLENFVDAYGERARLAEKNEGVDWKAVSHAFRAAYQVRHILTDGGYTYPLPETEYLKAVKSGKLHFANVVGPTLDLLMENIETLSEKSTLPKHVDRVYWDRWLFDAVYNHVGRTRC